MDCYCCRIFEIPVVLLTIATSLLGADSFIDTPRIALCWGNNFTSGSPYQTTLDAHVNKLTSGAANNGGFFYDISSNPSGDTVYGASMCFVDSKWADCHQCLEGASSSVFTVCPYSTNAAILYRDCLLRYSEYPFFSSETEQGHVFNVWVTSYLDDVDNWNNARQTMMNQLINDAAALPQRFASSSKPYGEDNSSMMYGLVQCRNDLTAESCTSCLEYQLQYLAGDFPNNVNTYADVRGFSCLIKLDRYPIVLMAAPGPSPLPAPLLSLKAQKMNLMRGITAAASGILFLLIIAILFFYWRQKRITKAADASATDMEAVFRNRAVPKQFRYKVLVAATGNFSYDRKLGEGGFGSVYRGFLEKLSLDVAIKRVSRTSRQGRKEYASEVKIISGLRHRNLVKLIGWCHNHELLLVYELMPNRSLDKHLYSAENILPWRHRYHIILGIGSALLYLHEECEQGVLHRDIKPSNIMLDASFNAKLGDFGLARHVNNHTQGTHTTELAGTLGYMDPACINTSKFSTESDIYSFGVVLLEVACGRQPIVVLLDNTIHLVQRVLELYHRGVILDAADPRLRGNFSALQMECVLVVGLWCTQHDQSLRPPIRQVISALRLEAALPTVINSTPVGQIGSFPSLNIEDNIVTSSSVYRSTS